MALRRTRRLAWPLLPHLGVQGGREGAAGCVGLEHTISTGPSISLELIVAVKAQSAGDPEAAQSHCLSPGLCEQTQSVRLQKQMLMLCLWGTLSSPRPSQVSCYMVSSIFMKCWPPQVQQLTVRDPALTPAELEYSSEPHLPNWENAQQP